MDLRIYLVGRVGVVAGGQLAVDEREFRDRQGRRAFAYLVACRGRPVPREELAEVIWPDGLPLAWEAALSAIVSRLRSLTRREELISRGVSLPVGFGQYQLCLPSAVWVDLEASTSAVDAAEGALRSGDPRRAFGFAGTVYAIAGRPFLAGDDGEWIDLQRRALERQYVRALDCLSEIWLASDQPLLAIETALQAVAVDRYRERSYRLLMRAHACAGNRGGAIGVYQRLRRLLDDELGVEPATETEALYRDLLT